MTYLIVALLLLDAFFGQLVPQVIGLGATIAGFYLTVMWAIFAPSRRIRMSPTWYWWLLLGLFAAGSSLVVSGLDNFSPLLMMASIVLMAFSVRSVSWLRPATLVTFAFSLVHVLATLAFYAVPSLYSSTIGGRFDDIASYAGGDYRSALTTHYSLNAMFCSVALLIAVSFVIGEADRKRWMTGIVLAVLAATALLLTTKRAHLVFAVGAIAITIASSNIRGRLFKIVTLSGAGVMALFLLAQFSPGMAATLDRLTSTFDSQDITEVTSGRTQLWDFAINGWQEKPILGNGWATYRFIWPNGSSESIHAHNALLHTLYEGGLVGLALFLAATLSSLVLAIRTTHWASTAGLSRELRTAATFGLSFQVFIVMYAFTTGEMLRSPYVFMPYLLAVAMTLVVAWRLRSTAERFTGAPRYPRLAIPPNSEAVRSERGGHALKKPVRLTSHQR